MKQARYKEPLPLAVIEAARAGDAGAVEQVLQYYNGYINKLCIIKGIFLPPDGAEFPPHVPRGISLSSQLFGRPHRCHESWHS